MAFDGHILAPMLDAAQEVQQMWAWETKTVIMAGQSGYVRNVRYVEIVRDRMAPVRVWLRN